MSGGRPTAYDPKYCDELVAHMAGGLSFESFAGTISVGRATLYNWTKAHAEFLDAKNIGTERSRLWWEKVGRAAASGQKVPGFDHKHFNPAVYIFTMKNCFKWTDRVEHTGDPDRPIVTETRPLKDAPSETLHEAILRLSPKADAVIAESKPKKKPKRKAK